MRRQRARGNTTLRQLLIDGKQGHACQLKHGFRRAMGLPSQRVGLPSQLGGKTLYRLHTTPKPERRTHTH
jgi:hypothetical protein